MDVVITDCEQLELGSLILHIFDENSPFLQHHFEDKLAGNLAVNGRSFVLLYY